MIVELNKLYILSAPAATEGMTPEPQDFVSADSDNMTFIKMKRVHQGETVHSLAKVFKHKDALVQAVIFYTDLPARTVKTRINEAVERYKKNAAEGTKAKK